MTRATLFKTNQQGWYIDIQKNCDSFLEAQDYLRKFEKSGGIGVLLHSDGYAYPQFGDINLIVEQYFLHLR